MLEAVLERFDVQRVILVADRGLLSLDNAAQLAEVAAASTRRIEFILAVPARRYAELGGTMDRLAFVDGIAEGRFADHRLVVAHDPVRAAEQGTRRRECIAELQTLADRFSCDFDEAAISQAERFDGKLVLLTSVTDFSATGIIDRSRSLADIERGFRVLKSDIEIPPVFHRLPERIRAHALICYVALVLYRIMRMRLKAAGAGLSPTGALQLLGRIQKHRAMIGETTYTGVSRMTPQQIQLFENLNLAKPTVRSL